VTPLDRERWYRVAQWARLRNVLAAQKELIVLRRDLLQRTVVRLEKQAQDLRAIEQEIDRSLTEHGEIEDPSPRNVDQLVKAVETASNLLRTLVWKEGT